MKKMYFVVTLCLCALLQPLTRANASDDGSYDSRAAMKASNQQVLATQLTSIPDHKSLAENERELHQGVLNSQDRLYYLSDKLNQMRNAQIERNRIESEKRAERFRQFMAKDTDEQANRSQTPAGAKDDRNGTPEKKRVKDEDTAKAQRQGVKPNNTPKGDAPVKRQVATSLKRQPNPTMKGNAQQVASKETPRVEFIPDPVTGRRYPGEPAPVFTMGTAVHPDGTRERMTSNEFSFKYGVGKALNAISKIEVPQECKEVASHIASDTLKGAAKGAIIGGIKSIFTPHKLAWLNDIAGDGLDGGLDGFTDSWEKNTDNGKIYDCWNNLEENYYKNLAK